MNRRHVLIGAVGVVSVGTFVAVNELQQPEEFDGDGEPTGNRTESPLTGVVLDEADSLEIPVAITGGSDERDLTGTVRDALAYWEENAESHVGFDVAYEVVEEDPYLTVSLQETVEECDTESDDILGCADIPDERLPPRLEASVGTSLTDRGVFEVAVHELGHTLGLRHGDEPGYYMSATRPNVWERRAAGVQFDIVGQTSNIIAGLSWVSENVDGVSAEFQTTTDRDASIVVERTACDDGSTVCTARSQDYDDQLIVQLDPDEDPVVYDWHVARLFAGFGESVPDRLSRETPREVRRSNWWEN